jgi:hypothetical protein
MTALSLSQAEEATGVAKITITRALKAKWHAATRKQGGSYEIDTGFVGETRAITHPLAPGRRGEGRRRAKATVGFGRGATGRPQDRTR